MRERRDRRHGIHDLVREDPHDVALRRQLDRIELALDRLDGDDPHRSAEPVNDRRAHHRRLRYRVERDRHQLGAVDAHLHQGLGEGIAIFAEIVDPHALMADQHPPRGLVGQLHTALRIDGEQGGGRIVQHRFVESIVVGEPMPLLPKAADALLQRLAELAEAAALSAVREALREVAEADGVNEAGQLQIGALHVAPQPDDRADADESRQDAGCTQPLDPKRIDEAETRQDQQQHAPDEPREKAAAEGHDPQGPALEPMLVHSAVERGARQAQLGRGERDIVGVLLESGLDHLLLGAIEIEIAGRK